METQADGARLVDGIPLLWRLPRLRRDPPCLALWLPALGLEKEGVAPFLDRLADAGFVAVSFDLWQHGERGTESGEQIRERVFANYRRYKWPILGQTTLDALRVIDWTLATFDLPATVVAGGISLGGDVAVALAAIDERVQRVATIAASPDWTSPGMHDFDDPPRPLDQGRPDRYAQWFYDQLDPLTHLDAYARGPAIAFECGADDLHVPAEASHHFQAALQSVYPGSAQRVRVTEHPGIDHLAAVRSDELHARALHWLTADGPT